MRAKLLLVDDDPRNLDALEAVLKPLDYACVRATGGVAALRAVESENPDLVLLDLNMPDLDGVQVLQRVRADARTADLPVVIVTATHERSARIRVLEAGADDFLEKPIDPPLIEARVKNCLFMKQSRDALRRANDALKERHELVLRLQQEQEETMQFIVHDLKTPIAAIALNLSLLSGVDLNDTLLEGAVADAASSATRLQAMVSDLLTIARLRFEAPSLQLQSVRIDELITSVTQTYDRVARQKKVELRVGVRARLAVRGDRDMLLRVLENLLENALRHTPPEGVVSVESEGEAELVVRVSNSGPAVPRAERTRIFDRFARGGTDGVPSSNVGLGLYFCKRAVEAHGGRIDVVETPEFPASFIIRLPVNPAPSSRTSS